MLQKFINYRVSSGNESYYHDFLTDILGLTTSRDISLQSNPESGNGFSDIILMNEDNGTAAILELKKSTDGKRSSQLRSCQEAVDQINEKQYDYHLRHDGDYNTIFKFGLSFWGKKCEILLDESGRQELQHSEN